MAPLLSPADEEIATKYRKLLKMGMPEGAVKQKMTTDGVDPKIFDAVIPADEASNEATQRQEAAVIPASSPSNKLNENGLSPEEEEIANKYRKMSQMGLPEGAVMQKMATDGIDQRIVDVVWKWILDSAFEEESLKDNDGGGDEEPSHNNSSRSFETLEEEIIEEEVVSDPALLPGDEKSVEYEYISDDSDMESDEFLEEVVAEGDSLDPTATQQQQEDHQTAQLLNSGEHVVEDEHEESSHVELTVDGEFTLEEEITVEEEVTVEEESIEFEEVAALKGKDPREQFGESDATEESEKPYDEQAAIAAQRESSRRQQEEMMNVAMETDDILCGQSGLRDDISETSEEEILFGDDNSTGSAMDVEKQLRSREAPMSSSQQQQRYKSGRQQQQRRNKKNPDFGFHAFVVLLYVLIIGGGVAVLLVFLLGDEDNNSDEDPNSQYATFMDPVQSPRNCNLDGLEQPHVIDQCNCEGVVSAISDSIRERYDNHRAFFIPTIYQSYDEPIESCTVRNQALLWLSSGNDIDFGPNEREQRFALANFFIGTKGEEWTDQSNWLSREQSCSWFAIACNTELAVDTLLMETNNVAGTVSQR